MGKIIISKNSAPQPTTEQPLSTRGKYFLDFKIKFQIKNLLKKFQNSTSFGFSLRILLVPSGNLYIHQNSTHLGTHKSPHNSPENYFPDFFKFNEKVLMFIKMSLK